jgi:hypothetical protein
MVVNTLLLFEIWHSNGTCALDGFQYDSLDDTDAFSRRDIVFISG